MREFLLHIFMVPLTAGAVLSLKSFWQKWPLPYRVFSTILLLFLAIEGFNILWKYRLHETNLWKFNDSVNWVYNFSLLPQYILFLYFFQQTLTGRRVVQAIRVLYPVLVVLYTVDIFLLEGIHSFNRIMFAFCSLIMVLLCIEYFNQLRKGEPVMRLSRHPMVWIVAGIFLYHATKFPFMLGFEYLAKHNQHLVFAAYYIYLGLGFIFYILFFIAYLCKPPQPK